MPGFRGTDGLLGIPSSLAGGMQGLNQKSCLSDFGEYYIIIHIFSGFSIVRKSPVQNKAFASYALANVGVTVIRSW